MPARLFPRRAPRVGRFLAGPVHEATLVLALFFVLLFCAVYLVHAALLDGFGGQTLGKRLLGIEVIREDTGAPPGPYRAALRACTFLFVDMFVGLFVMLASPKRQRPGNIAAGTIVVRERRGSRE